MTSSVLSAESLEIWRGERHLCRDLSFRATEGQAVRLHGANGAGKTTLIRILTGLSQPESGQICWNGRPIGKAGEDYHRDLAYLGHANGLKSNLSPTENLSAYAAMMATPPKVTITEALTRMGVGAMMHRPCASLSMGQQRRTALARLLISNARLWILDEPLTSLDAAGTRLLTELILTHLSASGIVIFATHQALDLGQQELVTVTLGDAP